MQPLHTLRVIQQHPVLQIHDPLRRGQQLTLPDVGIAERERIVYLHTALNSRAGGQRHRDDKEIFPLARRLLRRCTVTLLGEDIGMRAGTVFSCADTPCGKAAEWAGIQFFT